MNPLIIALRMYLVLTLLVGVLYTAAITLLAGSIFPDKSAGSLIPRDGGSGDARGSRLIGQAFTNAKYFWSRPSAVSYNPLPSGGSNLSVTGARLRGAVEERRATFRSANGMAPSATVPTDMLFASASGLDPDISPAAAQAQIGRVASARGFGDAQKARIADLVRRSTIGREWGIFGEPRVNVAMLNIALDSLEGH